VKNALKTRSGFSTGRPGPSSLMQTRSSRSFLIGDRGPTRSAELPIKLPTEVERRLEFSSPAATAPIACREGYPLLLSRLGSGPHTARPPHSLN
jgi:hypothetical protein